jgi:hypothetical protein
MLVENPFVENPFVENPFVENPFVENPLLTPDALNALFSQNIGLPDCKIIKTFNFVFKI